MQRIVMVLCAALLLLPVVMKSRTRQDLPDRAVFSVLTSGRIWVKVSGDVRHPGVYDVDANSLALSVINMAIPVYAVKLTTNGETAVPLRNGSAITLALQPDGSHRTTLGFMTVPELLVLRIPLDIALMNETDFDRLPSIGPALAKRIIEYRQNNGGILSVADFEKIEGIGDKKYKQLRSYFQHAENTEQ